MKVGTVKDNTLKVVIAPDSFKGSLAATSVAAAIAAGWLSVRPHDTIALIPQADGGEGTIEAIEAAVDGTVRHDVGAVTGPDSRPTPGSWLELPGGIAVVELAQMSGLTLMHELDAVGASTVGLGEVIRRALTAGESHSPIRQVVIALGGSASTDGAAGALSSLGLRATGASLRTGGVALSRITSIDRSAMLPAPPGGVILLTDVAAPLLGDTGAAAVFGPQKGATPVDIALLESALANFAALLGGSTDLAGTGAAGGAGFGFVAAWGARIEPGAAYLATLTRLPEAVAGADVLLTGEGRFDATSCTGKLVGEMIRIAAAHPVRVGIIAGQLTAIPKGGNGNRIWSVALVDIAGSVDSAIAEPARWLRDAGAAAASALT